MSDNSEFSFATLRFISSWVDKVMYCKSYSDLNPKHKDGIQIQGSFKFTNLYHNEDTWTFCGYYTELPEIISHYLKLNLTFVTPNNDFDGTLGWHNQTHSKGPLKMISDNQVDYIFNEVLITKNIWNPNLYELSTALFDDYTINFLVRKQLIKISIADYFKIFNLLIWMLVFGSIITVSAVQTIILLSKFKTTFFIELSWNYSKLLLNKPSNLIPKLLPRHYIMYLIPLLSVLIINLLQNVISANLIVPRKQWCQDIDCLVKSKLDFLTAYDEPALISLRQKEDWQFKVILKRLTVGSTKCKLKIF